MSSEARVQRGLSTPTSDDGGTWDSESQPPPPTSLLPRELHWTAEARADRASSSSPGHSCEGGPSREASFLPLCLGQGSAKASFRARLPATVPE